MPDGLLKELTQEEIVDLFAYLSSGSVVSLAKRPEEQSDSEPVQRE